MTVGYALRTRTGPTQPPVGPRISASTLGTRLDPRANALNAVRLVLACAVIVSHSWMLGRYGRTPNFAGETLGGWSVFAFFVLSGYLVTGSRLSTDFTGFVRKRVLRIYPGFVVCLLATVVVFAPIGFYQAHHGLSGYASTGTTPIDYLLADIGMKMNAYHVAGTPTNSHAWTGSLWSLYFEFLCYLLVGLLAFWRPFRRRPAVAVLLLAMVTTARLQVDPLSNLAQSPDFVLLLRLVPYFLAGSVLFLLRDRIPCRWPVAAAAALAVPSIAVVGGNHAVSLCALPMGYVLLYVGAVLPVRLGRRNDISYGMYMYGYPVEQLLRLVRPPSHAGYIVLAILCTVPLAAASWFLVERPAMRLGRSRRTPRPPTSPLPSRRAWPPSARSAQGDHDGSG